MGEAKYEPHIDTSQGVIVGEHNTIHIYQNGKVLRELQRNQNTPSSVWSIPYRRNLFFTGREDLLKQLHDKLSLTKTAALTQAITGLGGIGKTQTAIEYAYRYYNEYSFVFWVRAASHDTLISDFVTLAELLQLVGENEQDQNKMVTAVKQWLATHGNWLLILDNADDLEIVSDFMPTGDKGHILLTTRAQFTGTTASAIEVEKMDIQEGGLLLLRRAKVLAIDTSLDHAINKDRTIAETIVKEMDGLPLALDQAGAYLEETGCSLSEYLSLYRTHRQDLLKRRGNSSLDHPEPVATTWALSFQKIEQVNPGSADLLRLCAFLDPDAIHEEIITKYASNLGPVLKRVAADPFRLNEAIEDLRKFSLLRRNSQEKILSLHRLVQVVLKDRMVKSTQRRWAERAVQAVNNVFPPVEVSTWPQCQRYLPQAQICAALIEQHRLILLEGAQLLYHAGRYLHEHAQYTQAELLYQRAFAIEEQVEGFEHPNTVNVQYELARLHQSQGQYTKAQLLYQHVLTIHERILGPEHPDTAATFNQLARLQLDQGHYTQAELFYQRALAVREKVLGPEHPDTAASIYGLAVLYNEQGQHAQAEPLYQRALAIRERVLGPEHPDTAASLNNLAVLYSIQEQYAKAKLFFRRTLSILKRVHGLEHPDTAACLNNLAALYRKQGQHVQAEALFKHALTVKEKALGLSHRSTIETLESYIYVLQKTKPTEVATLFKALALYSSTKEKSLLLEGNIRDHLTSCSELLHQNLFFVSFCLTIDIPVENQLAERMILQLSHLVATSPFLLQRDEALEGLASLMSTHQYAKLAYNALTDLVTRSRLDDNVRLQIAQAIYVHSHPGSVEVLQAKHMIMRLASSPSTSFRVANEALQMLYWHTPHGSEASQIVIQLLCQLAQRPTTSFQEALSFCVGTLYNDPTENPQAIQMLIELIRRSDITFEQRVEAAQNLYLYREEEREGKYLARQILFDLMQQPHLSVEEQVFSAQAVYYCSFADSQEGSMATQILLTLVQLPRISVELAIKAAKTFYKYRKGEAEENLQVVQTLLKLLQRPDISSKDFILINEVFCQTTHLGSKEYQQALLKLSELAQAPSISFEECVLAAEALGKYSSMRSKMRQQAIEILLSLLQRPDISVEQTLYIARIIYKYDATRAQGEHLVRQILFDGTQRTGISFDQIISIIWFLYEDGPKSGTFPHAPSAQKLEERQLGKQIIAQFLQKQHLTSDQQLQLISIPLTSLNTNYADKAFAVRMILSILQEEAAKKYLKDCWQIENNYCHYNKVDISDEKHIIELAEQEMLSGEVRNHMYRLLRQISPLYRDTSFTPNLY